MNVLLSFLHFGPYHLARLDEARSLGSGVGVSVDGLAMARTQTEYAWLNTGTTALHCLSVDLPLEHVPPASWSGRIAPLLSELRPDVVAVAGYSHPAMLALIRNCLDDRIPLVVMSDSRAIDEPRLAWREAIKSRIVRLASAGFVAGAPHRAYLRQLGLPDERIFEGYDAVDNARFASGSDDWRTTDGPQAPHFLASARFIPEKNLFRLLDAYSRYAHSNEERRTKNEAPDQLRWPLVLLGDGELKPALLAHAAKLGLTIMENAPWEPSTKNWEPRTRNTREEKPTVFLPGFRQIDELPRFYAHAGLFIHPSIRDTWGLVVNEAMASGLPVIVSNRCGCAPDLVKDGVNGWTFDPLDVDALAGWMGRVAALPEAERRAMGEAGRRIVADWGPERFATGLIAAAKKAVEVGPKRASWFDRLLLTALIHRPTGSP